MNVLMVVLVLGALGGHEILGLALTPIEKGTGWLKRWLARRQNLFGRVLLYPVDGLLQKAWLVAMAALLMAMCGWVVAFVVWVFREVDTAGGSPLFVVGWLPLWFLFMSTLSLLAEIWRWIWQPAQTRR